MTAAATVPSVPLPARGLSMESPPGLESPGTPLLVALPAEADAARQASDVTLLLSPPGLHLPAAPVHVMTASCSPLASALVLDSVEPMVKFTVKNTFINEVAHVKPATTPVAASAPPSCSAPASFFIELRDPDDGSGQSGPTGESVEPVRGVALRKCVADGTMSVQSDAAGVLSSDPLVELKSPRSPTACGLCGAAVGPPPSEGSSQAAGGAAPSDRLIDGRPVCEDCGLFFEPEGFVPRHHVCVNPLCRRKWKQLTPKMLPLFCPPCKRNLEEVIPTLQSNVGGEHKTLQGPALLEQMYRHWHKISMELADVLGYPAPLPIDNLRNGDTSGAAQEPPGWREVLRAFRETFPAPPDIADVRNWNSVHGRRKHFSGRAVRRSDHRFVRTIEVQEELSEDLVGLRAVPGGAREFPILDWHGSLLEGQVVQFIAFPNPAIAERDKVSRVVRLLNAPGESGGSPDHSPAPTRRVSKDPPVERVGGTVGDLLSSSAAVPARAPAPRLALEHRSAEQRRPSSEDSTFASAFSDVLQWSNDSENGIESDLSGAAMLLEGACGASASAATTAPAPAAEVLVAAARGGGGAVARASGGGGAAAARAAEAQPAPLTLPLPAPRLQLSLEGALKHGPGGGGGGGGGRRPPPQAACGGPAAGCGQDVPSNAAFEAAYPPDLQTILSKGIPCPWYPAMAMASGHMAPGCWQTPVPLAHPAAGRGGPRAPAAARQSPLLGHLGRSPASRWCSTPGAAGCTTPMSPFAAYFGD